MYDGLKLSQSWAMVKRMWEFGNQLQVHLQLWAGTWVFEFARLGLREGHRKKEIGMKNLSASSSASSPLPLHRMAERIGNNQTSHLEETTSAAAAATSSGPPPTNKNVHHERVVVLPRVASSSKKMSTFRAILTSSKFRGSFRRRRSSSSNRIRYLVHVEDGHEDEQRVVEQFKWILEQFRRELLADGLLPKRHDDYNLMTRYMYTYTYLSHLAFFLGFLNHCTTISNGSCLDWAGLWGGRRSLLHSFPVQTLTGAPQASRACGGAQ